MSWATSRHAARRLRRPSCGLRPRSVLAAVTDSSTAMVVKKEAGIATKAAALTHHGQGGGTAKLSHSNSNAATQPTDTIATRRLRTTDCGARTR